LHAQLQRTLAPASVRDAGEILLAFERWRYSRSSQSVPRAQLRALRSSVRRFRPTLA
jgi:hypothetical protein